jgi:hypothetical protein
MTERPAVTDASLGFSFLDSLIAIAADPEAARRRMAEVRAAVDVARAEAEAARADAERERVTIEAERAKMAEERAALDEERAKLSLRSQALREGERGLGMLKEAHRREQAMRRAPPYVGPPIVPRRAEEIDDAALVRSDAAYVGPPILPRRGLGGRYPKRQHQEI